MTLYEKYAKHLHDTVCSYRDVDLDVALYYAIAAMDFLDRFGVSTWCNMGKIKIWRSVPIMMKSSISYT